MSPPTPRDVPPAAENPTSSEAPKQQDTKAKRGNYRQRRIDNFREKKGATAVANNDQRLNSLLFQNLTKFNQIKSSFKMSPEPKACDLPLTTRGLGFITTTIFNAAQRIKPEPDVTIQALYRVTLAQFDEKMRRTYEQQCRSKTLPETPRQYLDPKTFLMENVIQTYPRNFTALTTALNLLGNFEAFGKFYQPFLPYMDEFTIFPAGGAAPVLNVTGNLFDPYLMSFMSLSNTLAAISNPATPLIERIYFVENSALPGAVYQNYVLRNSRAFLPARYEATELRSDCVKIAKWLDKLPEQYRSWRGTVDYSGKGSEALLVNSISMSIDPKAKTDYHSTPIKLTDQNFAQGILGLYGEFPPAPHQDLPLGLQPRPIFAARSPSLGCQSMALHWSDVIDRLLRL